MVSERIAIMTRWLYLIAGLIIIVFFTGLYIMSSNLICWLPVFLVVGDSLRTMNIQRIDRWEEEIERHEESDIILNFKRKGEEVNLFTDVFIKKEDFSV